ncbi:phytoene/squalene synthase family protein [Halovivax limisalsi]|uniref:phytoene/squalene synthase family protein n=1 Tax=Halovivax limisalsi TaxID=1453760 RepID=UPI003CCDF2BA
METHQVATGRAIQRATGRTFHLATRLLPERVRRPTYVLYGFFRIADEVVDDPGGASPSAQRERLDRLRAQALGREPTDEPVVSAFCELRREYDVPDREVEAFVDAMQRDTRTDRYATRDELDAYMRGSAAAVGAMMTAIMEPDDPDLARPHAHRLGEAFQLTNFLRDVAEDVRERDRIYLPAETLSAHGASVSDVERLTPTPGVRAAVAAELARTEERYRAGVRGIRYLPRDCQFPVLLAAVLYAEHHRHIRARDYDVLSRRPSLSRRDKLRCLVRTWWYWTLQRDPVAVFERASAVPTASVESATGWRRLLPSR